MNFKKDQKVKVIFRNGTIVEGFVIVWDHQDAVLTNKVGDLLFINNAAEDVMLVELRVDRDLEEADDAQEEQEPSLDMRERTIETYNAKRLKEKKRVSEMLTRTANPRAAVKEKDKYELPDFTKRSALMRSTTKTR